MPQLRRSSRVPRGSGGSAAAQDSVAKFFEGKTIEICT